MNKTALLPNRAIEYEKSEEYFASGLGNIFGANHFWQGMFPGSNALAHMLTPKLTIEEISKRLVQSGVSTLESSLDDAKGLVSQKKLKAPAGWPHYYQWEKFLNPHTGKETYRFTPIKEYD